MKDKDTRAKLINTVLMPYYNKIDESYRNSCRGVFCTKVRKVILEVLQNSQKNTCARDSFFLPEACNFIKKETPVQGFSCEFCKNSKNTFYYRTPLVVASGVTKWQLSTTLPRSKALLCIRKK